MAEKKEQQIIEGAADVATSRVKSMAKRYIEALAAWQQAKPAADDTRSKLIEQMQEDGVEQFTLNGTHEIVLKHLQDKIKVKSLDVEEGS